MDAALLHAVRAKRRAAVASCAGLQSRELPPNTGDTEGDRDMVAHLVARAADQDRCPPRAPRPLRRVPDGRGRAATRGLLRHPRPDQHPARAAPCSGVGMIDRSRAARCITCGRTGASGCRRNGAKPGRRSPLCRSSPPVPSAPKQTEAEYAWRAGSGSRRLIGNWPNGKCRVVCSKVTRSGLS